MSDDPEAFLGWIISIALLAAFAYLPISSLRDSGLRGWFAELRRRPAVSLTAVALWIGCMAFLIWIVF